MDQHERERERGRTSRASSTSSLGREVRCACQFFQSDSLLPERRAMQVRPSSRNAAHPTSFGAVGDAATPGNAGEHEYEPVGTPLVQVRTMTPISMAPVVRIVDTDVAPVADSDDSIDLRGRFTPGPMLDGNDLILPLDGRIEDSAMETKELAGGGDTSEELESPQQLQDRLEERFFNAATPCTESRTDGEVNTSQVDSSAMEELPLRRGARGLPQRLRSQAGKLRSRLKGIQRPNFSIPIDRLRPNRTARAAGSDRTRTSSEKTRTSSDKTRTSSDKTRTSSEKTRTSSEKTRSSGRSSGAENKSPRAAEKRTRMERLRSSLPDRPKINFPERPKFNFPDRSKFHLPERPKFNIKKPNIKFPSLGKSRSRAPSLGEVPRQRSTESASGSPRSRRNIFDFSTYPRLFDKKSKTQGDYATSSPNESRAQSTESSTLPRAKKTAPLGPRWAQRFTDIKFADDEEDEGPKTLAERTKPWRRPSLEEPRLSLRPQESLEEHESLPWEDSEERKRIQQVEEMPYEEEELEEEYHRGRGPKLVRRGSEDSYDEEPPRIDPRLYGDQDVRLEDRDAEDLEDEESMSAAEREAYRASFMPVDPRIYKQGRVASEPVKAEEEEDEEEEPLSTSEGLEEDLSARSDREQQQSSGSSCDRRRRGVIEEIDSDEFFLREKGISQDDMNVGRYLTSEIRDALRTPTNALAHEVVVVAPQPPQRPARTRSMRKRKETSVESYDVVAPPQQPARPKREQRRSVEYEYGDDDVLGDNQDDSISSSRHRVVYHAESAPLDLGKIEPLDDIVVVKPIRRKSKSSLRSQSLRRSESLAPQPEEGEFTAGATQLPPPPPPRRRKRLRAEEAREQAATPTVNGIDRCNGHHSPVPVDPMEVEPHRIRTPAPKKPERAASREALSRLASRLSHEEVDSPPPVPPKRLSRSRGASLVPDDDRTSHGADSIPSLGYGDDDEDIEIPQDDNDSRLDYPGYAVIDKREKPPRPPPPRRRRDDKFATSPRSGVAPSRPQRAYSTLRPARSRTPSEDAGATLQGILDTTPYEELDSEDDELRDLRSGIVVSKIQGRPLPAPPRPPRARRERNSEDVERIPRGERNFGDDEKIPRGERNFGDDEKIPRSQRNFGDDEKIPRGQRNFEDVEKIPRGERNFGDDEKIPRGDRNFEDVEKIPRGERNFGNDEKIAQRQRNFEDVEKIPRRETTTMEAFASTQTDPLPDDMVIEEEITQAKLVVSPSRSGSQILVSTERIPSPTCQMLSGAGRSSSQGVIAERPASPTLQYSKSTGFVAEPPERSISEVFGRPETSLSPVRRSTAPTVPPLPNQQSLYRDEDLEDFIEHGKREKSRSPELPRERTRDRGDYERDEELRIQTLTERIRLEEDLDEARRLHAALHSTEPLKIASLEVGDLRVDRLSVSNLEAHKISASEIDALVVSATELSNPVEPTETTVDLQPTLLRELIAIRSQLELANSLQESPRPIEADVSRIPRNVDAGRTREIGYTSVQQSQPVLLQLDQVPRGTETRAIFSSVGSSRESSPQPISPPSTLTTSPAKPEEPEKEQIEKTGKSETKFSSRSRSPSPGRTSPTGLLRQTTSPVKSLPPVISVTPDSPDVVHNQVESSDPTRPQRAVLSFVGEGEEISPESQRERSPSPHRPSSPPRPPNARFIAFSTSQIPPEFFALASPAAPRNQQQQQPLDEPGVVDLGQQLFRALSVASKRAMRHFVGYVVNRIGHEETDTKMREVELALCALLLIIAGLLIVCFGGPRTITHHHHWDYFNPPKL